MKGLIEKIEDYKKTLLKTSENRKIWLEKAKQIIYDTLSKAKKLDNLDWLVDKNESVTNMQTVYLGFNTQYSGITTYTEKSISNHPKRGGALSFSQIYNGQVVINCNYPYIEGWMSQKDDVMLAKVDPTEITEEFVIHKVEKFLDEMIKWEEYFSKNQIGFRQ